MIPIRTLSRETATWIVVLLAVIVVATGVIVWLYGRADRAERRAADAALAEANAIARADTTRALAGEELAAVRKVYGDSIIASTRLVVQTRQERDAIDRKMNTDRKALAEIVAVVRALEVKIATLGTPTREDTAGVRRAEFVVDRDPYRVRAAVSLPRPPAPGVLDSLSVSLAPARLSIRLGCEAENERGLRPARAVVTGPPWLTTTLERVEQDPGVCPDVTEAVRRPGWLERVLGADRFVVGAGGAAVRDLEGNVKAGPAIFAGVRLIGWP